MPKAVPADEMDEDDPPQLSLKSIRDGYERDSWFSNPKMASKRAQLVLKNGIYYKDDKIVVPNHLRLRTWILQEFHDSPTAGHMGFAKTYQSIKRLYWWPRMKEEIRGYIKHCPSCQRCKPNNDAPSGLLRPLPIQVIILRLISLFNFFKMFCVKLIV